MERRNIFTQQGLDYQKARLRKFKEAAREAGNRAGAEAGMNCDWHDNPAYDEAKADLEKYSRRAKDLESEMSGANVVEVLEQDVRVRVGNTVGYLDIETDDEKQVTIGAWGESDANMGLVSYTSPLAKALIGAEEGDERVMRVEGKGKSTKLEVLEIFPPSYKYHELIQRLLASIDDNGSEE